MMEDMATIRVDLLSLIDQGSPECPDSIALISARTPGRSEKAFILALVPPSISLATAARSSEVTLSAVAATPQGTLPASDIRHSSSGGRST